MDVLLKVDTSSCNLGPQDGLTSLFDTIACRLEPEGRGSRFPVVSHYLRLGRIPRSKAARAVQELELIGSELLKQPATHILWVGQPAQMGRAANAAERLTAPDGQPLLEHLLAGVHQTMSSGHVLRLVCPTQTRRTLFGVLGIMAAGVAWALVAHAWVPRLVIAPASQSADDPMGIPVWSFGLAAVAFVVPSLVGLGVPAFKVWYALHTWAVSVWALIVVVVWFGLALFS